MAAAVVSSRYRKAKPPIQKVTESSTFYQSSSEPAEFIGNFLSVTQSEIKEKVAIVRWSDGVQVKPASSSLQAPTNLLDWGKHFNQIGCPDQRGQHRTFSQAKLGSNVDFEDETVSLKCKHFH